MIRVFSLFLAVMMTVGVWTGTAEAQSVAAPVAAQWDGKLPPDGPQNEAQCLAHEVCGPALRTCRERAETASRNAEQARKDCPADMVIRFLPPKPPAWKPVKYVCNGPLNAKPLQTGNLCKCGNNAFVAVTEVPGKSMMCVPAQMLSDLTGPLQERIDKLKLVDPQEFANLKKAFDQLQKLVGNPSGYEDFAELYSTVLERIADHEARIKQLRTDVDGLMAKKEEAQKPLHSTGAAFEELLVVRPLVGAGMMGSIVLRQNWWFTPDSLLSVPVTASAGYYSSYNTASGPSAAVGGTIGLRLDLTADRRHSIELAGKFTQFMLLHPAGYQGVVQQQGMGFFLGPRLGYGFETKYLRVGCSVAVGGGKANALPNTGVMLEGGGPQFMGGCHLGGHVRYGD